MLRMSPFTHWILQELEQTVSYPIGRMMMIQNGRNRLAYQTNDARLRNVITREMTFASRSQKAMPRFQRKENRREVAIYSKFEFTKERIWTSDEDRYGSPSGVQYFVRRLLIIEFQAIPIHVYTESVKIAPQSSSGLANGRRAEGRIRRRRGVVEDGTILRHFK